jgi:hypothetical protein
MNTFENQKTAANYMGALAHALGGRPGRHREFIEMVEVILSGSPADGLELTQFVDQVREDGRPVLWLHQSADTPNVPDIGLVIRVGSQVKVFENCMLCAPRGRGPLQLVPDCFNMGAFRFDEKFRLRHLERAPASDFETASESMIRAYVQLRAIEAAQRARGDVFELPTYVSMKQAA